MPDEIFENGTPVEGEEPEEITEPIEPMEPVYNRHYVRLDDAGRVIMGFSDAFAEPLEGDICVCEQGGRHFELGGVINPSMLTDDGIPLYEVIDGAVAARSDADIEADRANLPAPEPTMGERLAVLEGDNADIMEYVAENDYRICLIELGITPEDL